MPIAAISPFSGFHTPDTSAVLPGRDPSFNRRSAYDRRRDLPRLIPLWPSEIDDVSAAGRAKLIQKLRRALREERRRGLAGHWTYDLARHFALHRAFKYELAHQRQASVAVRSLLTAGFSPSRGACQGPSSSPG